MQMTAKTFSAALFTLLLGLPASWAQNKTYKFIGEARNKKGEVVYIENHETTENAEGFIISLKTNYTRPNGETLVKMESDFSKNVLIPEIKFEDVRFQRKEDLTHNNKTVNVKIFEKEKKKKEKSFKIKGNMVAGTGFHNFILKNFEDLKNGKQLPLSFIVLAKADFFVFDLVKKEIKGDRLKLHLKIHNWFLKNFIDTIIVEYDLNSRRLLNFDGLTNIEDDKSKPQELFIEYKY